MPRGEQNTVATLLALCFAERFLKGGFLVSAGVVNPE